VVETLLLLNGLSLSSFLVSHGSATGREEERPSKQDLKHLETIYLGYFFVLILYLAVVTIKKKDR